MADTAEFVLGLVDKVSAPAKKVAVSLFEIHSRVESLYSLWRRFQYVRTGGLKKDVKEFAETVKESIKTTIDKAKIGGAAAVAYTVALTQGVVRMGIYAESSRRALSALTGSVGGGTSAFKAAANVAKELGLGVEETVDSFKHLLAMQFSVGEATDLVRISADLQAVTGDAESAHRAITALTQIKAKGKLQAEELVGQLAEAGVSTVLVYKELGAILGKDVGAVRKMISAGEVDADTGIRAIKAAIMTKLHESSPGEAAKAFASSTLQGMLQQLQSAPGRLFLKISDAAKQSLMRLGPVVKEITSAIDNMDTSEIVVFVERMLEFASGAVKFAKEFFFSFLRGTNLINEVLGTADFGENQLRLARELGRLLASAAALALYLLGKIAKIAVYLNDNRWILNTYAAIWALYKLFLIARLVSITLATMGAMMWIWRTFHLGTVIAQTLRWSVLLARTAWGLTVIRNLITWIGGVLFRAFVLGPLVTASWVGLVIALAAAIFIYWDEIVDAVVSGINIMVEELDHLRRAFSNLMRYLPTELMSGDVWSEAGSLAAIEFWNAFWGYLWKQIKRFTPGLGPGLEIMHMELQALGLEKAELTAEQLAENQKLFRTDQAVASTAPATAQSDEAIFRSGTAEEVLQHLRKKGDLHIGTLNVNVQSDGTDPASHGKAAAEGVEKELRSHWSILSTEFGGG